MNFTTATASFRSAVRHFESSKNPSRARDDNFSTRVGFFCKVGCNAGTWVALVPREKVDVGDGVVKANNNSVSRLV